MKTFFINKPYLEYNFIQCIAHGNHSIVTVIKPFYITSSNIKYIDNQLVTTIKVQMICKCKYKTI